MNTDFQNILILATAFLLLFALAEILYHYFSVKVELTRKLVHVGTGLLALFFPLMLGNHWLVLLLCASFSIILLVSLKFKLLPSINAIERKSVGSLAYPLAVYTCYLAYDYYEHQYIYYYLPIIILAICDPIAALSGKQWPIGKYKVGNDSKTIMGSSMFFISSVILVVNFAINSEGFSSGKQIICSALIIGVLSTITEAISKKGWDNFTIPISVLVGLIFSKILLEL